MDIPDFGIPPQLALRMSMAEQHEYLRTELSRRRTLVTAGAVTGGLLTGCSASGAGATTGHSASASPLTEVPGSAAAPFGRHLAFGADPRTRMRISWQLPAAVRKPYVRIGLRPDDLDGRTEAELRDLKTPEVAGVSAAVEQYYLHAALDGLRPGTTYYYGVGHDGFDPASPGNRSTIASSARHPRPRPSGSCSPRSATRASACTRPTTTAPCCARTRPSICTPGTSATRANPTGKGKDSDAFQAGLWDVFLKQTEPVAKSVPWMVTTGNHDMEAWYSPDG